MLAKKGTESKSEQESIACRGTQYSMCSHVGGYCISALWSNSKGVCL